MANVFRQMDRLSLRAAFLHLSRAPNHLRLRLRDEVAHASRAGYLLANLEEVPLLEAQ